MPIYIQLVEMIKLDIITNKYELGEKIPSVRDLALEIKVNPNTIQRALIDLEESGLIITKRTSGKFVTDDKRVIDKVRNDLLKTSINNFFKDMNNLGITKEEVIKYLANEKEKL